jgi:hypothetical protein
MNPTLVTDGFTIIHGILTAAEQKLLVEQLGPVPGAGRRGMLADPQVSRLARSEALLRLVRPHLPAEPRPVRAIYFDKSPEANWLVPWHQDLTLAVHGKIEHPGFGPWSVKDGVSHVQPPAALLEQMLTVRLHLDDAGETNGALRVLPGSHTRGRHSAEEIQEFRSVTDEHLCSASAGDALLMRPLLLHASSRSTAGAQNRRVLHIEYAGFALPAGLTWNEAA